jgi:hypothetical protein
VSLGCSPVWPWKVPSRPSPVVAIPSRSSGVSGLKRRMLAIGGFCSRRAVSRVAVARSQGLAWWCALVCLRRFHVVSEAEVLRSVLLALQGLPSSTFHKPNPVGSH